MEADQSISKSIDSQPTDEELQAFIGAGNYLSKWRRMRENRNSLAGFNFGAFVLVHTFFFYRKMYLWGFIFIAATLLASFGTSILYAYIGAKFQLFSSIEQFKHHAAMLALAISFLIRIASGVLANKIYYSCAAYSIQSISKLNLSGENRMLVIKEKGGVNMAGFALGIAVNVFFLLV